MNWTGSRQTIARPFGAQLDEMRGEPKLAAGLSVTPIARRLALWWPGGGWVYAWPVAVEYPEGTRTRRLRIMPIQPLTSAAFAVFGLAAFTTFATRRWRQRRRSAEDATRMRRFGRRAPRQRRGRRAL